MRSNTILIPDSPEVGKMDGCVQRFRFVVLGVLIFFAIVHFTAYVVPKVIDFLWTRPILTEVLLALSLIVLGTIWSEPLKEIYNVNETKKDSLYQRRMQVQK